MDIDVTRLFIGLIAIRNNREAIPNRDLSEYAFQRGNLYDEREYGFLKDIENAQNLSESQRHWLRLINRRIIERIVVREMPNQQALNNLVNQGFGLLFGDGSIGE